MVSKKVIIAAAVIIVVGAPTYYMWSNDLGPFEEEISGAKGPEGQPGVFFANAQELENGIGGNTLSFSNKSRPGNTIVYYAPDHTLIAASSTSDMTVEGEWRTRKKIEFCQHYNGRNEKCEKVVLTPDSAKFHNDDGKLLSEAKVLKGKQLPAPRKKSE
jgi:hypothetical protein